MKAEGPSKKDRMTENIADILKVYDALADEFKARGVFGAPYDQRDPPVATGLITPYLVFDKAGSIWYRSQYGEPRAVKEKREKPESSGNGGG